MEENKNTNTSEIENSNKDKQQQKTTKKDSTKTKKIIVAILIGLVLIASGYLLYDNFIKKPEPEPVVEPTVETNDTKEKQPERQLWLDNKAINDDYIGEVVFESGLVNKSFVQAKDVYDKNGDLYHFYTEYGNLVEDPTGYTGNDVYIWTNWQDMSYDYNILGGSVFMDYRNELSDQNIIIYGHHFSIGGGNDPERVKAFTPVELLLNEDNYEANKKVKLVLDNETRTYEIFAVYVFDIENDNYLENAQYWRTNYNYDEYSGEEQPDYYQNYIDYMKDYRLYDTDVELTTNDNTLTLQTCIGGSTTEFEIVVLKEIDCQEYVD